MHLLPGDAAVTQLLVLEVCNDLANRSFNPELLLRDFTHANEPKRGLPHFFEALNLQKLAVIELLTRRVGNELGRALNGVPVSAALLHGAIRDELLPMWLPDALGDVRTDPLFLSDQFEDDEDSAVRHLSALGQILLPTEVRMAAAALGVNAWMSGYSVFGKKPFLTFNFEVGSTMPGASVSVQIAQRNLVCTQPDATGKPRSATYVLRSSTLCRTRLLEALYRALDAVRAVA